MWWIRNFFAWSDPERFSGSDLFDIKICIIFVNFTSKLFYFSLSTYTYFLDISCNTVKVLLQFFDVHLVHLVKFPSFSEGGSGTGMTWKKQDPDPHLIITVLIHHTVGLYVHESLSPVVFLCFLKEIGQKAQDLKWPVNF